MIQSDELSSLLWSRIEPYLGPLEIQGDPYDVHIHGIESLIKGSWQPYGLNNVSMPATCHISSTDKVY